MAPLMARKGGRGVFMTYLLPFSCILTKCRSFSTLNNAKPQYDAAKIAQGLLGGNRFSLSKAITLVESTRQDHRKIGSQILEMALAGARKAREEGKQKKNSFRIGISGPPGVGKSTFIEALGMHMISAGHKIGVIAVDPSSHLSGGSILGDKTRMNDLAMRPESYIRPCATAGHLGGIAQHTDEVVLLCESAGFDLVLIETVGVGGDALQGIKRGIVEAADLIVINKADGDLLMPAKRTQSEYRNALMYMNSPRAWGWRPEVLTCSAAKNIGIDSIFDQAVKFWHLSVENGSLEGSRGKQRAQWMWSKAEDEIVRILKNNTDVKQMAVSLQESLGRGDHSPRWAAEQMVSRFLTSMRSTST